VKVLILGAAGFLGLHVLDALRAAGVEPLCGRRRRTNILPLKSRRAVMVQADLDDEAGLLDVMQGCDVVVHAAGHYPKHSLHRDEALQTGLTQLHNVLRASRAAGVPRVVYVSSTATVAPAVGRPSDETDVWPVAPGFGVYHDLKWAMEQEALADPRVLVACPGACIGPWDLRIGTSALLVGLARGMNPPHPDGNVAIVDAADVGAAVARMALGAEVPRRVLLAGSNHRLHALLTALAARYGAPVPSPPLSADAACALADAEEARALEQGGRALLAREIVDLVVHGAPISSRLAEEALGVRFSPLADTLDRFDAWARRMRFIPELSPSPELTS
jgi:dihydroflavonol-4-reductase